MKKFIALLLGTILCFSLMACEGMGESSESSTTNSTVGEQEATLIEKQYQEIKEYLNNLSVVYDYESEQGLTGQDALHFAYTWFNEHSDYKDCADYLVNFTVVDDALTKITKQTTDAFGQVEESVYTTYDYDKNGKCFQLSDLYKTFNFLSVINITEEHIKECRYDDKGQLVGVDLYYATSDQINKDIIGTKIAIEYDDNGNIIEADFLKNDGKSWSNTYTYNELNQLTMARNKDVITFGSVFITSSTSYTCEYHYDMQGSLVKVFCDYDHGGYSSTEYTYNEDGQIKEIRLFHSFFDDIIEEYYVSYMDVYTYDEKGRISYIEYIPLGTTSGLPYKLTYHYEDIIVYTNN